MKLYYGPQFKHFVKAGVKRKPKKGEYFLSGAIPGAYLAFNDMNDIRDIMRPATKEEIHCPCCGQKRLVERG